MSKNIEQVYLSNPITSNVSTDLMYFGQSPYGVGDDAAMQFSNFAAQFSTSVLPNTEIFVGNASNIAKAVPMSGDISITNTGLTTIVNNAVTYAKFQEVSATSLVGNSTSSLANAASISSSANNQVMRSSGGILGFGSIDLSQSNTVGSSILGLNNGGTNSTSSNFYSNAGAQDGIVFYDSTKLTSVSSYTYDPTQGIMAINSSSANPGINVFTTSILSNIAFISASRSATGNGEAQYRLLTASTNEWTWGTFSGSQDLLFTSHNGANTLLSFSYSTNDLTINSGNLIISNASKTIQINSLTASDLIVTDASKNLISGSLSGDLTTSGTVATFNTVNSNIGTFGSATQVGTFTVNGKGLITAASNVTITGVPPGGSAGGDLTGTYPNPTIAANAVTNSKFRQSSATSVIGNSTALTANVADISSSANGQILRQTGGTLGFGSIDLSQSNTVGSSILGISNGGNNIASQTTNGILFNDGTHNTSNSSLVYTTSSSLTLINSNIAEVQFSVVNGTGGGGAEARILIQRNSANTGYAQLYFQSGVSNDWTMGTRNGDANLYWLANGTQWMELSTTGLLKLSQLTASSPVFTDSSSQLTNSGVVPQANGGTNATSYGSNRVIFQNSGNTAFTSTADLTYAASTSAFLISTANSAPTLEVQTTLTGSTNSADIIVSRGDAANGTATFDLNTGNTTYWKFGMASGSAGFTSNSADMYFRAIAGAGGVGNVLFLGQTSGDVTIVSGNLFMNTNGKVLQFPLADADKILFYNTSNDSKIDTSTGWNFNMRAGSTGTTNTGLFNWYTSGASGWTNQMTLANAGDLTLQTGNLIINTPTKGYQQKAAVLIGSTANACLVTQVVLVSGTSGTLNNSAVTTSHVGFANCTSASGTITFVRVTCGSGTFTVTGGALDNSTYAVLFVKAI